MEIGSPFVLVFDRVLVASETWSPSEITNLGSELKMCMESVILLHTPLRIGQCLVVIFLGSLLYKCTLARSKLEPDPPRFLPYLEPGIDFRPETSPYFPKDFDIDRPPHDKMSQAPRFLRQEHDTQYGVKGQNTNLFWFVYGYPKPTMAYYFNDVLIESGGQFDMSYTRNGQATLFINK